jgi:hypothetical protein
VLLQQGEAEDSVSELRPILKINPDHSHGARYPLLAHHLETDQRREAGKLLDQFDEDESAPWLYGRALLGFKRDWLGSRATESLRRAFESNPFIPITMLDLAIHDAQSLEDEEFGAGLKLVV